MPALYTAEGWKITMYFRDHAPPHFHVMTRDRREAQIRISDLAVMAGHVPGATLAAAREWAAANKPVLMAKWDELHPR